MKRMMLLVSLVGLLALAGCSYDAAVGGDGEFVTTRRTSQAVFVNDSWFCLHEERQHLIPAIDDDWVHLGQIQSAVDFLEIPSENFQTNATGLVGAHVYHSPNAHIRITNNARNEFVDRVIYGEAVIVSHNGRRILHVSEETIDTIIATMNEDLRQSLMVDGVRYSLMSTTGGGFVPSTNHTFLGEIAGYTDSTMYPTEHLQANRANLVGARVYRLPEGHNNDLVAFFNMGALFFFRHLPAWDGAQ